MNVFLTVMLILVIIVLALTIVVVLSSVIVSSRTDKDAEKYYDNLLEKLKNNDDLD